MKELTCTEDLTIQKERVGLYGSPDNTKRKGIRPGTEALGYNREGRSETEGLVIKERVGLDGSPGIL
jgi:hypothetical protein